MESESLPKDITLFTGAKMPIVGFGLFDTKGTRELLRSVIVEAGYRHIDTASMYGNEAEVGQALQDVFEGPHGIKREDIFVTTKLHQSEKVDPEAALKRSLEKLKLDYVDLYLIHWPQNPVITNEDGSKEFQKIPLYKLWKQLEDLVKKGLTKHIGISNFNIQLTLDLLTYCEIKPAVNQIEVHPYLVQYDLVEYLKKLGIVVVAYSPIGAPGRDPTWGQLEKPVIENPVILELAKKYGKTPAQIVLNWGIQRGQGVIPKSSTLERQKQNLESQNFALSKEDVDKITALDKNERIGNPRGWASDLNVPVFA